MRKAITLDLFDTRKPDTALFSADGVYRFELTREIADYRGQINPRPLAVCGINPSTATADEDDRTIARVTDYARRWGCQQLRMVNAYGFIDKKPAVMFAAKARGIDIIGDQNDAVLRFTAGFVRDNGGIFLAAWGTNIEPERELEIEALLVSLGVTPMCLAVNDDGSPGHPLYLKKTLEPVPWKSNRKAATL